MPVKYNPYAEWLEADGFGGFASGTVGGIRTRRYHALLLAATTPPTGRFVLVNGVDAWVETPDGPFALSSHAYAPDVTHPDGARRVDAFEPDPWPHWTFRLEDGTQIDHEIIVPKGTPATAVSWRLRENRKGVILCVRPLVSGRGYHALHRDNSSFRFDAEEAKGRVVWRPYPGVPGIIALTNGAYDHDPDWFRNFRYVEEQERGLHYTEDLAAPGTFKFDLSRKEAVVIFAAECPEAAALLGDDSAEAAMKKTRASEKRRRERFPSRLHRAADAYLVRRGEGSTIVAGYPWFTDWGRDTFIALRGLCIAAGDLDRAREILVEWAGAVSEGMLPNHFTDPGGEPEYNSVDASLWYVIAVHDLIVAAEAAKKKIPPEDLERLIGAADAILDGYLRGTRHGIRLDDDGLLAAGAHGMALTWMDAKVDDQPVTPRAGKPVEVQSLWLNALKIASAWSERWKEIHEKGLASFRDRFWNESRECLYDVVDVDHEPGTADATLRPNQIFAVGGLPFPLLEGDRARRVVEIVEEQLLTPLGLRSLAPGEPGYAPHCRGGVAERDGAYQQGTVWPWLIGPFVEAWVRVRGGTAAAKAEARERFLAPLIQHLDEAGIGHISEIADGDPPHAPRGCPFQAWSVGEAIRLDTVVLSEKAEKKPRPSTRKPALVGAKTGKAPGAQRRRTTAP